MVQIHSTQPDHRAERSLPGERRHFQSQFGIALELKPIRSRSLLILINHERADEPHAVIAQMPSLSITIRSARKRHSPEHQKISSAIEKALDRHPTVLRKGRAIRQNQEMTRLRGESGRKSIGPDRICCRGQCRELRVGRSGGVRRWKCRLAEYYCSWRLPSRKQEHRASKAR